MTLKNEIEALDAAGCLSRFAVDDEIIMPDGSRDTVRACFIQTVLLQPWAKNEQMPAVVLTLHSWMPCKAIIPAAPVDALEG